jgi:hypothetical protein
MKKINLALVLGMLLALPVVGHAQIIYSDSFESDTVGNPAAGWTLSGSGLQFPPYFTQVDVESVGTASTTGQQYVTYSNLNGSQAAYVLSRGTLSTTPNDPSGPTPGNDQTDFKNANVGATFLAGTTYTLTYLAASQNLFGGASTGSMSISLMGNGAVIGASTQTITTLAQDGTFASGPTVTFDTASNPSLVGQNIGIDAGWLNISETQRSVGWDDFVITASTDAAPEPSSLALLGLGLAFLVVIIRHRRPV